jgi:hypothetical protein
MNEQCLGCPWLDEQKKQCRRTSPRFCSVDELNYAKPLQEVLPAVDKPDEAPTKIHRAA